MNTKILSLFAGAFCLSVAAYGEIKLPSVFSDNMVLQQNTTVRMRGEARPGSGVTISPSWSQSAVAVKADSKGHWAADIKTPSAGGPYTVRLSDGEELMLDNVLVGEVWFCAGQSNMEMPVKGFDRQPADHAADIISRAKPAKNIRAFVTDTKRGTWIDQASKVPQSDMKGEWLVNSSDQVPYISAVAYTFAAYINEVLEVPVGVLVSTLGGSRIEAWLPREVAQLYPEINLSHLDTDEPIKNMRDDASVIYNAKVAPLHDFPIRGMLWYQGESNRDNASLYERMMPAMVKDYRDKWGCGEFPVYFVEIAPFNYEGPEGTSAARFREAQTQVMKSVPRCEIVSTLDIGHPVFIHPTDKVTVGNRLARLALADTYGQTGYEVKSPVFKSIDIQGKKVYVNVDNAPYGLCPMWTELEGFEIAGSDKVFHPAKAEIETSTCRLVVWNDDVDSPVAVRYAYKNYPAATVFDTYGLPLLPFRSDNW